MEEKLQTHGIKFKDKFGYALGDMGGVLTFSLISSFLNMFYTDVLGISAANIKINKIGILLLNKILYNQNNEKNFAKIFHF